MFGLDYIFFGHDEALKLIYLAGPYTHKRKTVMNARERALTAYAAQMVKNGLHVWSPITESHQYSKVLNVSTNWEFWREHDLMMLAKCDELRVLMLVGWEVSVGVAAEIAEAKRLHIPVVYVKPGTSVGG